MSDSPLPPPPIQPPYGDPYQNAPVYPKKKTPWALILIVLFVICGGGITILAAIMLPVFASAKVAQTKARALSHLKQTSLGMYIYAADAEDRLPLVENWTASTQEYVKSSPPADRNWGLAMNPNVSGLELVKMDNMETALLFVSKKMEPNASDKGESVYIFGKNQALISYCTADCKTFKVGDKIPLGKGEFFDWSQASNSR
jgi:hypothetical protein